MPQTQAEREAEHQRLEDTETAGSLATGIAQWQVRAEFPSHRETVAPTRKLGKPGPGARPALEVPDRGCSARAHTAATLMQPWLPPPGAAAGHE